MLNIRSKVNPVGRKLKRYNKIISLLDLKPDETVLNVGCGEGLTFENFNKTNPIIGTDLFDKPRITQSNFKYVQRTDETLPFKDKEFDAVVSIGVLEHIHPHELLLKTCQEIDRVGKKYLILVPNYWTIIEPHYAFPFFQLLPENMQKTLTKGLGLRYADKGKEYLYEEINYFKTPEWKAMFPGSQHIIYWHIGPFITNLIIWKK